MAFIFLDGLNQFQKRRSDLKKQFCIKVTDLFKISHYNNFKKVINFPKIRQKVIGMATLIFVRRDWSILDIFTTDNTRH